MGVRVYWGQKGKTESYGIDVPRVFAVLARVCVYVYVCMGVRVCVYVCMGVWVYVCMGAG